MPPGTQHVITHYRDLNVNLRAQLERIIRRAGLEVWPKLFQNLRSTRETELTEEFPMHLLCKWIGNSQPVAAQHYLQLTDEHFDRAVSGTVNGGARGAQNPAQKMHETTRSPFLKIQGRALIIQVLATNFQSLREPAKTGKYPLGERKRCFRATRGGPLTPRIAGNRPEGLAGETERG